MAVDYMWDVVFSLPDDETAKLKYQRYLLAVKGLHYEDLHQYVTETPKYTEREVAELGKYARVEGYNVRACLAKSLRALSMTQSKQRCFEAVAFYVSENRRMPPTGSLLMIETPHHADDGISATPRACSHGVVLATVLVYAVTVLIAVSCAIAFHKYNLGETWLSPPE